MICIFPTNNTWIMVGLTMPFLCFRRINTRKKSETVLLLALSDKCIFNCWQYVSSWPVRVKPVLWLTMISTWFTMPTLAYPLCRWSWDCVRCFRRAFSFADISYKNSDVLASKSKGGPAGPPAVPVLTSIWVLVTMISLRSDDCFVNQDFHPILISY